jgi:hypothetical protein
LIFLKIKIFQLKINIKDTKKNAIDNEINISKNAYFFLILGYERYRGI